MVMVGSSWGRGTHIESLTNRCPALVWAWSTSTSWSEVMLVVTFQKLLSWLPSWPISWPMPQPNQLPER